MADPKADAIRSLSDDDLAEQLEETYRQLFNLRFQLATHQLTNHREIRKVKRQIARLKTIQRERQLAASGQRTR